MTVALVALLCRTSDRTAGGARGARALAGELGERLGMDARIVGSPGEPRPAPYDADLRTSRGCLLEAGGQVDDALGRGAFPILTASDCSICMTTLPAALRHRPEAQVLWLDAHADFNAPDTTPSGFLGGMCLAAACGVWDAGLIAAPPVDPARVVMCGSRDLDPGERTLVDEHGIVRATPGEVVDRLDGLPVYVHLDLDVLDPSLFPAQFPAPGGLSDGGLRALLGEVAEASEVVGLEITAFEAPDDETSARGLAELVTSILEPLISEHRPQ